MKWLRAVLEIMLMCSCTHILYISDLSVMAYFWLIYSNFDEFRDILR